MLTREAIKKVLLVMPPATISGEYTKEIQPPLGLAYIAACLENDYEVRIIDAACLGWDREQKEPDGRITYGLPLSEVRDMIRDYQPDVVGVSCLFSMQYQNAHRVCAAAKEAGSGIITVMGGAHPTALPELTLKDANVDYVILGEGDFSFKELLDALRRSQDLRKIDGLAFRDEGGVVVNPKTKFIEDLDCIPFPARHLLPMEAYFRINLPHGVSTRFSPNTPVITSRGCPAHCTFCSIHGIWGYKYRGRSAQNIIQELKLLKDTYGVKEIQFEDDNLTFDKKRALELFEGMVNEKLGLAWTTPNGVSMWNLDPELLAKMKESGCYRLCLAIESGDQKMLTDTIKKPLQLGRVTELLGWINAYGFETDAFFVVGFPEETREQLMNTFAFASRLKVDNVTFYLAAPYPGTELYRICKEGGYLPEAFSWESLGVKKASICSRHLDTGQLEKMVAYYTMKHKLSLLWRNPRSFYKKVVRRFFKTPKQFIALFNSFAKKILR